MLGGIVVMFEVVVIVFVSSLFFAILLSMLLLGIRVSLVIRDQKTRVQALLIILLPGSIGYYHFYPDQSRLKTWYQRLVIMMFVLTLIGSIYLAFLNIPAFASWFFYGF